MLALHLRSRHAVLAYLASQAFKAWLAVPRLGPMCWGRVVRFHRTSGPAGTSARHARPPPLRRTSKRVGAQQLLAAVATASSQRQQTWAAAGYCG